MQKYRRMKVLYKRVYRVIKLDVIDKYASFMSEELVWNQMIDSNRKINLEQRGFDNLAFTTMSTVLNVTYYLRYVVLQDFVKNIHFFYQIKSFFMLYNAHTTCLNIFLCKNEIHSKILSHHGSSNSKWHTTNPFS